MKTKILFIIIAFTSFCNAQIVNIPDANFKAKLLAANTTNGIASTQNPDNVWGNVYISSKIDTNNDGEIQVSEASVIKYLTLENSNITNLEGINSFTNLRFLCFDNNQVSSVNLNSLINLKWLRCNNNLLTSIDVLSLSNLYEFKCEYNQLSSLNLQGLTNFKNLYSRNNQLSSLNVQGTIIEYLDFRFNQITTINLQGLITLRLLNCGNNQITSLNLQGLNLYHLYCNNNLLTSLDLQSTNYYFLDFSYNSISQINLQGLINLDELRCNNNQLTHLNLDGLNTLSKLYCSNNQLTTLNLQVLTDLDQLDCSYNQITGEIDLQNSGGFGIINCNNNLLTSLFIKNGGNDYIGNFSNNPNLQYICCDDNQSEYNEILLKLSQYGMTNCHVNSYCSFTPGGTFYEIHGNNKFDENTNGCDALDTFVPNLKFNINNGSVFGSFITNNSGNTNFAVQAGTHTISPVFENPTYFNVFPSSATVSFPSTPSPFMQDFCISANGSHPDLEILALPFTPIAHAGSDVVYKIIYKNNGTMTQSGSINLFFDDSILDLVQSMPTIDSQTTNNLNWNFSNLKPFETREIYITLNTNSPIEVPPLFTGSYLNYTATISSSANDENINDNVFHFRQVIDSHCGYNYLKNIKGKDITPEEVGKYVYYMIGIENIGTASVQNIVAKNIIDTSKFEISTLQIIESSHSLKTKITSSNKIEFIFENINLQNTSNANRGYVAYKIKTKSNLVVGDSFSNLANIYFDYNFPIETENITTNIVNSLGLQENDIINDIATYPNPVKDFLNFKTEDNILKIEIYDIAGRILSSNSVSENKIDLSNLKTGNYILKLYTEKGIMNTKIIKE